MGTTRTRNIAAVASTFALVMALAACAPGSDSDKNAAESPTTSASSDGTADSQGEPANKTVRLVAHDSFVISDELKAQFTKDTGYELEIVTNGDGGALVNKLVLTKDAPLGDAVFGVDNTFASRGIAEGVFAPYTSDKQSTTGTSLAVPGDTSLNAIDYGDVCLNLDTAWFTEHKLAEPQTFEDLTKPEYKDLTVVTNPATSSPGLSMLLGTIGAFGADGYLNYWQELKDNGVKIDDGWEDAYYVDFTGAGEGDRPIALSYASSPAFTVSDDGKSTTTSAMLDTCFRQTEYAGVLAGAKNPEGAKALIDFLLGVDFQNSIADAMYMYPVSDEATLPSDWANFAPLPTKPIAVAPADIADNRDAWLKDWSAKIIG